MASASEPPGPACALASNRAPANWRQTDSTAMQWEPHACQIMHISWIISLLQQWLW